jgi:hypothetical protein
VATRVSRAHASSTPMGARPLSDEAEVLKSRTNEKLHEPASSSALLPEALLARAARRPARHVLQSNVRNNVHWGMYTHAAADRVRHCSDRGFVDGETDNSPNSLTSSGVVCHCQQVLRFVGRVSSDKEPWVNVAGVILDAPRDPTRFKSANGAFGGVQVLDCPPGYGFVTTLGTMEKSILRVFDGAQEAWICHSCHHANKTPRIDSVLEYLELSLAELDSLVRCEACCTVRVWHCPHESCIYEAPLEVAEVGLATETAAERFRHAKASTELKARRDLVTSMLETFTCPRCMLPPTDCWPCPQCDSVNVDLHCVYCESMGEAMLPQRDSVVFLLWLRNPILEVTAAWDIATGARLPEAAVYATPQSALHHHQQYSGVGVPSSRRIASTSATADRIALDMSTEGVTNTFEAVPPPRGSIKPSSRVTASSSESTGGGSATARRAAIRSSAGPRVRVVAPPVVPKLPTSTPVSPRRRPQRRSSASTIGQTGPDDHRRFEVLWDAIGQVTDKEHLASLRGKLKTRSAGLAGGGFSAGCDPATTLRRRGSPKTVATVAGTVKSVRSAMKTMEEVEDEEQAEVAVAADYDPEYAAELGRGSPSLNREAAAAAAAALPKRQFLVPKLNKKDYRQQADNPL